MAKTNYTFEKRQRELAKKKRKEEKRLKKRLEKGGTDEQCDAPQLPDQNTTPHDIRI
jgi:hypothetical protein